MLHPYIECHRPLLQDTHKDNVKKRSPAQDEPHDRAISQLPPDREGPSRALTAFLRDRMNES
jgi:hypothetical protein